jgi:hypothetical protein
MLRRDVDQKRKKFQIFFQAFEKVFISEDFYEIPFLFSLLFKLLYLFCFFPFSPISKERGRMKNF